MTRHNSRSRNSQYRKNGRPSYFGLWLFTIVLFLIFTIGLVYLGKHKSRTHINNVVQEQLVTNEAKANSVKKDEVESNVEKNKKVEKQQEQTFEFYDILTQNKIDNKTGDNTITTSANSSVDSKANSASSVLAKNPKALSGSVAKDQKGVIKNKLKNSLYVLEILKTKDFEVVDHAKAELALVGYEINITTTKSNNSTLYLITVGPYNSKDTAVANQKQLTKYNIKSLVKQMKS